MSARPTEATSLSFPARTVTLHGADPLEKRREIRAYFHETFSRYEQLFELLACDEAYYDKPIPIRHPLVFYFGHTATFFVNKLVLAGVMKERIDPALEAVLAIGVDEMSWDDVDTTHYDWPTVEAVRAYRARVRAAVDSLIATMPLPLPIDAKSPWWVVLMGIEHEQIHLETSSVLIRQHDLRYVRPHPAWRPCAVTGRAPKNRLVGVPAGDVVLGKADDGAHYGWDNEYGRHEATVPPFSASQYLVSNEEFLAFVEDGGYASDAHWEEEGRAWRRSVGALHPTFWVPAGRGWRLRLLAEEIAMPWSWPVEVNFHEAKAFCTWKAAQTGEPVRLPTEDEWHRLRDVSGVGDPTRRRPAGANLHLDHHASPCPVDTFRHGELYDVVGNVWQWTETPINGFEGFAVHPVYDDFSTPTFDGRHNLLVGGSWISCGNETLETARYAFRRHFFQHAGFRYVVAERPKTVIESNYETDKLVAEYAEFHYGDEFYGVPNFPTALARLALAAMDGRPMRKALDLGCATGRATFELARSFEHVTGIDFSARFIRVATQLLEEGALRYELVDEGALVSRRERTLRALGLEHVRGRVAFWQGDACNLKEQLTGYDLVLAANLVDRLYSPAKFLSDVGTRVNPGGLLVIASPYTWLEEHTPRAEWIGGFEVDGAPRTTLEGLKARLSADFELVGGPLEVPFVIRETKRKFQHSLSEVTIWERR